MIKKVLDHTTSEGLDWMSESGLLREESYATSLSELSLSGTPHPSSATTSLSRDQWKYYLPSSLFT